MTARNPTTLEYALLGLLHQQPQSGYDLRRIFETTAMGNYSGSPGAIYPALGRLEKHGLIEGDIDTTRALRPKKVFRPTMAGTTVFRGWLAREIQRGDVERRIDELMLRFAFHGVLGSSSATRRFLEKFLHEIEGYVDELQRQAKIFPRETPIHPRLALAAGIEQYRACARWARKALEHFKEEAS
jgi:DNA-binding PadR family transcriptional regulator